MGVIYIDKLNVYAYHGVFEKEKANGQNFYVSCRIELRDSILSDLSDDIDHTVSYADVCDEIHSYMLDHSFNLLESIADCLACHLLNKYPGMQAITVRIDKPEAPIAHSFLSVAYEITRKWHTAYLSLGSNIGDREGYLLKAIQDLSANQGIRLLAQSEILETKPYGVLEQDYFMNACVAIETFYTPSELLRELHKLENDAKRVRTIHWGPRTLDLDILLYEDQIIHTKELTIPHIDMHNRSFVLEPLNEIASYAYHPILRQTIAELWEKLRNKEQN